MSTELTDRISSRVDRGVTNELAIGSGGGLAFVNVTQLMEVAKLMAISQVAIPKHLRDNPGACLAVAIQASEWEMSPFAVANKSYSVNDRLSYESQLVNAVILKRAPIVGRFKVEYSGTGPTRRCRVSATLTDGEIVTYESPEIGKITTQNSPLWKSDPDQQLFYFASRSMCRRHFPDVLLGVYTPEEMAAETRDVTPTDPAVKAPKFLAKPQDAAPTPAHEPQPEPATAPQVEAQPEPQAAAPEVAKPHDEHKELLTALQDAMNAADVSPATVRKWAFAKGLLETDKMSLKSLSPESLRIVLANFHEITA